VNARHDRFLRLLAIPNVSEGRDAAAVAAIGAAFAPAGGPVRLLDVHRDPDHHRSVFTLAGAPGQLAPALAAGAREALARVDLRSERGAHPHVGVVDVAPVVHLDRARRGAACAEALLAAELLGELGLPVFLYGALAGGRTRAQLRRGGLAGLVARGTPPDFGPPRPDPRAGAVLVAARPPLVAFNLELAPPATLDDARRVAAAVRAELEPVRALGIALRGGTVAQVSTNVEDHEAVPLARLLAAVERHAGGIGSVAAAELVGLAPRAAFAGWPDDRVPIRGRRAVEDLL